jgi:hypothetical protein
MSEEKLIRHDNLKRIAESRGLSAKDLATTVGGHVSYWYGLLDGSRPFGEKTARRIEEKLGLKRYELDEAPEHSPQGYVRLDERERAMVEAYRALSKEARQIDLELAQFGEFRAAAYQRLLEHIEALQREFAAAASPSAPAAETPKTRQARSQRTQAAATHGGPASDTGPSRTRTPSGRR